MGSQVTLTRIAAVIYDYPTLTIPFKVEYNPWDTACSSPVTWDIYYHWDGSEWARMMTQALCGYRNLQLSLSVAAHSEYHCLMRGYHTFEFALTSEVAGTTNALGATIYVPNDACPTRSPHATRTRNASRTGSMSRAATMTGSASLSPWESLTASESVAERAGSKVSPGVIAVGVGVAAIAGGAVVFVIVMCRRQRIARTEEPLTDEFTLPQVWSAGPSAGGGGTLQETGLETDQEKGDIPTATPVDWEA